MFEANIEIHAPIAGIQRAYQQVEAWPQWDPEVIAASIPAGLIVGATGWLQPRAGPRTVITVIGSGPDHFYVQSRLPFCRMVFGHRLEATATGARVAHDVQFYGLLAPLFRQLIGRQIASTLPVTLSGLKRHVEAVAATMAA